MIALTFAEFRDGEYDDKGEAPELYVLKDGNDAVLYVGISQRSIWHRWFYGPTGHFVMNYYGEYFPTSSAAQAIHRHRPDSDQWIIELWTRQDCFAFLSKDEPRVANWDLDRTPFRMIEALMIQKLEPSLNVLLVLPKRTIPPP